MADAPQPPLIDYPTTYTFKVMGRRGDDFPDFVRDLVGGILGRALAPAQLRVRESTQGTYQSVTVDVRLETEDERQAVYRALWASERVVFYL